MEEFKSFKDFREEIHRPPGMDAPPLEPGAEPGNKRKKKKKQPFHFPRTGIGEWRLALVGAAAVLLCFVAVVLFLPVSFGEIRLSGNREMSLDDVLFDGGVEEPVNVWQVSTSEFERRLAMDVRVESVRVTRAFPFYIDVEITERRPVAVVQEIFGYALLDKEGVVLQTAVSLRDVSLPAVTGVKSGSLLLGDKTADKEMLSALSFLGALSENASRDFSEINIGNPSNVIAYTREGVPVWLGVGDRMPERAALAERMLKDMKTRKLAVEHIDASLTSPYFKMKA